MAPPREHTVRKSIAKQRRPQASAGPKPKFYAVRQGKNGYKGVVNTWQECSPLVTGVSGAKFKSFRTYEEAADFAGIASTATSSALNIQQPPVQPPAQSMYLSEPPVPPTLNDVQHLLEAANMWMPSSSTVSSAGSSGAVAESMGILPPDVSEPPGDAAGVLIIYTDGSCSRNGYEGARAGYGIFFAPESPYNVSEPLPGPATNQRAEMFAALEAMRIVLAHGLVRKGGILQIHTDSMYTKKGMDLWIEKWRKINWKTAKGTDVKNKDLWVLLDQARQLLGQYRITLKMIWVKGHAKIYGNEEADRLAVQGMMKS